MARKNIYRMDSGEWVTPDKTEGEGRSSVLFTVPSWTGREDRLTLRIVRSGKNAKTVTLRQLGVVINDIPTDTLEFPMKGGDKQIMITTNAAALEALITSEESVVKGYIKAFTTASGLTVNVNDRKLNYGFPGDPGLKSSFEVSIVVSMDDNSDGDEVNEVITINGKLIRLHQPGRVVPYIRLDKEFDQISGDTTRDQLSIESNLEGYKIEIVDCQEASDKELNVDKALINFSSEGSTEQLQITTKPDNLAWRIKENNRE